MNLYQSLCIALSMYSKIPVPHTEWTKERMKYALCFFPLVGGIIGMFLWLLGQAMAWLQLPVLAYASFGTVIPLLITGGIHMDGFLDVMDAKSSYQSQERKLEILQDPHVGAFAVLGTAIYLILYVGLFSMLAVTRLPVFAITFMMTRALSGLGVIHLKKAKNSGLAAAFSADAEIKTVSVILMLYLGVVFLVLLLLAGVIKAILLMAAAGFVFGWYSRMANMEFGGITGDLAGYFLQICELVLLFMIVLFI